MSLATQARVMDAVTQDSERTSDLAFSLWRSAQSLSVCPSGALAMPHVRQSMIEARDALNRIIEGGLA